MILPVLNYHSINESSKLPIVVSPAMFTLQMEYLQHAGFQTLTIEQFAGLAYSKLKVERPLLITFDDGYQDIYLTAFPILKRSGFCATIFLTTNYIAKDEPFPWHPDWRDGRAMDWTQIKEMKASGFSFGSHSCSHPKLSSITYSNAKYELETSKKIIEENIETPVIAFAYPSGDFNTTVIQLVQSAGYVLAFAEHLSIGQKEDRFCLQRIGIYGLDNMAMFRFKLSKVYGWMLNRHILPILHRKKFLRSFATR